ncbi:hypothetical protein Bca52824_061865 [Brassica carinata]|uniref:TraB family protein n=1 Tax=Brassica carinata TaxID=52824 RepID=A0A8X7QES9_BRACI|nr:hypothetical protein Bca52824_061865 [Brassica carinata]
MVLITFKRTWAKMPLWLKVKCIYFTLFVAFFLPSAQVDGKELEEMDSLDTTTQMSKDYPSVMDTFVHERDQYMSYALLSVASERSSVVAVVGSSHIDGIKKKWKQPISMKDLMEIPESVFKVKRIVSSVAIGFAGIAIVSVIRLTRRSNPSEVPVSRLSFLRQGRLGLFFAKAAPIPIKGLPAVCFLPEVDWLSFGCTRTPFLVAPVVVGLVECCRIAQTE